MVGVPPAVGFVGKWYVVLGAVEAEAWPLVVVILASTMLTLAYFARVLERIFFRDPDGGRVDVSRLSIGMQVTVVVAALAAVALGMLAFEYGQMLQPTVAELLA